MAKKYGSTWWGQQWLNALSSIDNSNRLPRGRTYANTGRVRSTEVSGNTIAAKVQGSTPKPYRIAITVPLFSEENKRQLVAETVRNPAIVARLLNRELPPDLLQFAEEQGIKVFPKTWRDFAMTCSCPDYAVPCKHLAAVIYTVADEIDRNPFMVFEMHGLDLVKELEGQNIRIAEQKTQRIPTAASLLLEVSRNAAAPQREGGRGVVAALREEKALDFTTIPALGDGMLTLFKPNPLFFEKDFKVVVAKLFGGAEKTARKWLRGEFVPQKTAFDLEPEDRLQLVFDKNLLLAGLLAWDKKGNPKTLKNFTLDGLVQILLTRELEAQRRAHPSSAALFDAFNFSLHLAKNGAVMPQLLECGAGEFRIRWLPAVINAEVRALFERIAASLPPDLLTVQAEDGERSQSPVEALNTLCSVFIGSCVVEGSSFDHREIGAGPHPLVKMFQFTTDGKPLVFKSAAPGGRLEATAPDRRPGRKSKWDRWGGGWEKPAVRWVAESQPDLHPDHPQLLQLWLNNFYLTHKNFVPLVKVEDEDGSFTVELMVEDRREPLLPPVPLKDVLKKKKYEEVKFDVLKDMMLLAEYFPRLSDIVGSQGERRLLFDSARFVEVLLKMLPALGLFGISILLPKGMRKLVRPQASLLAKKSPGKNEGSFLSFEDLMSFDWQIALGGQLISVEAFEGMVRNLNGVVKLQDQYVLVDEEALVALFKKLETPPRLSGMEALQALLAEEWHGVKIGLSAEAAAMIRQFVQPAEVPLPAGLTATLRPYQRVGYEWILKNTRLGFGSLLADDMGLGKTIQVIAALLRFKEEGLLEKKKALVVVPTSLLTNWRKEIEKFAPTLRAHIYHGQNRSLDLADADVVVTTYGIVRSEQALLKKTGWHCTVVDEAQNIKNAAAEQAKSVKALPADVRIAMSGTPVENRLSEFWSILDFTNKGYLGSPKQFTETFARPIQRDHDQRQAELFKKITAPFLLRRLKSDKSIIADLPDKIESNQFASLTPEQAAVYQNIVQQSMKGIFDEGEELRRQGLVLKMITALKQVCNHPHQFLKKGSKAPELSGKAALLLELLSGIFENGEKTLIFTQYQEMGELLSGFIADTFDKDALFLHGGTSRPKRDAMVEAFQNDPAADTFILSLKAGGTGLNLTAATNVVHYDLWWNPAVEAQATDRAYRIGQQRNVMVWRLITQGTFEEKIDEMIQRKKDLANLTVAVGENWIGNLSNEDLKALVALG